MTNLEMLREKIDGSGYKIQYIASALNLSYQGFLNKLKGLSEFGNSEISSLCKLLHLTIEEMMQIFFDDLVDET